MFVKKRTTERLAETGANESDDTLSSIQDQRKRFPPSAPAPPVLPFPFRACRLPLGSSYITFLHCFVPHLSFPFPPTPAFPFDKLLRFLRLVLRSPDARLWKGQLLPPSRSVTLTFRVQISHLAALPNVCIPPPLSQTCGKYMCTKSAHTTLKMDMHILNCL